MKRISKLILFTWVVAVLFINSNAFADTYSRLIKKGNRYYRNELFGEALKHYLEGRSRNPKALEPFFNAGDAYYKNEDYRSSIKMFNESLKLTGKESKKADIYYNLGNSYLQSGEFEKAVESYIKGLKLFPADLNMKYNLEIALKRLEQQKKINERMNSGGSGPKASEKGLSSSEKKKKESDDEPRQDLSSREGTERAKDENRELSREEAERLLRSANKEQAEIINDIIKKRTSSETAEKDW